MASLGTPESLTILRPIPGTSKGAQPHCPKKCYVSAGFSFPLSNNSSNQDTPKHPSTAPHAWAANTTPAGLC